MLSRTTQVSKEMKHLCFAAVCMYSLQGGYVGKWDWPGKWVRNSQEKNTPIKNMLCKRTTISHSSNSLLKIRVEITVLSKTCKNKLVFARRGTEGDSQSTLAHTSIFVRKRHVQTDPSPILSSTFSCNLLPDLLFCQQFVIL